MLFEVFLLTVFTNYLSESCVRTIPPEEVYISSTAANLPSTEEAEMMTKAMVTEAMITEEHVTTEPSPTMMTTTEEAMFEESETQCEPLTFHYRNSDVVPIEAPTETDDFVELTQELSEDGKKITVKCQTIADRPCRRYIYDLDELNYWSDALANALASADSAEAEASVVLTCEMDGTYSKDSETKNIKNLICQYHCE